MRSSGALRLLVLAVVVTAAVVAAGSAQAAGVLYGVVQEQVWGCPSPPGSPPTIGSCPDSTSPDVTVTADCHPDSTSTIDISVNGYLSGSGSFTEQIHAQIGPQTGPPAQEFKPFPSFSGGSAGSIGLPTGQLTSYTASFTLGDGTTGTKSLVPDLGNTGVCLDLTGQSAPNNAFPVGTLTGRFWILNAQSLSYDAVIPNTSPDETGVAEAYFDDSYATYDGSGPTDPVASDDGSYLAGFGTTHVDTAPGTNVTVSPSPNVSLDFSSVRGDGVTSAQPLTSPPQVPANFQVGNPPVAFDISTTASFTGSVTVCLPYGTLPPGDAPALLHYDGTQWVDVTTSVDQPPGTVCGSVTSFSPFVAAFAPAAPKTTADCKNGGWMKYTNPKFKNQGDCVSWVATHGRNGGNG